MSKEQTKQVLNQLVADLSQQSVIVHQAHWYMRGATFITMHPLMDQHMELLDAQLDEVSERLITLGGAPYSTLREFADNTKIADAKGNYSDSMEDRIRHLLVGYRYLIDLYQKGIDVTGEEGDDVTQDIFIGAKGALEKLVWMLQQQSTKHQDYNSTESMAGQFVRPFSFAQILKIIIYDNYHI